jgi:hypothetical protein
LAALAEVFGIEPIIGAFFAGLALNRLVPNEEARRSARGGRVGAGRIGTLIRNLHPEIVRTISDGLSGAGFAASSAKCRRPPRSMG